VAEWINVEKDGLPSSSRCEVPVDKSEDVINRAIEVAAKAHEGQVRKGTDIPYISHPYAVGMMLAEAGCSPDVVAAGILHDTVEDTYVTLDYLRANFGEKIASIVEGCSEPHKSAAWEERKKHTLEYLRTAPWEVRVVACADKLHNVRSIANDYRQVGNAVWQRFKRGKREQEWYYRGLVEALCDTPTGQPEVPFCPALRAEVNALFGGDNPQQ